MSSRREHFEGNGPETMHLRLGLGPLGWDSNPVRSQTGTWTHSLLIEVTYLVSGLSEAQVLDAFFFFVVLDVFLQNEFCERQSDR